MEWEVLEVKVFKNWATSLKPSVDPLRDIITVVALGDEID